MGNANTIGLTAEDIDELQNENVSGFSKKEIEQLYARFRKLDKAKSGFISAEEFQAIPELTMNPLCHRIIKLFDRQGLDRVNFKDFVRSLWVFSSRSSTGEKLEAAFKVYDIDEDGVISKSDLLYILKLMTGENLTDDQCLQVVDMTLGDRGFLDREAFDKTIGEQAASSLLTIRL